MLLMTISARKALHLLIGLSMILVVLHFVSRLIIEFTHPFPGSLPDLVQQKLNLDGELNLSSWFGQLLHFVAAGLLLLIGFAKSKAKRPYARHWLVLGLIFLFISFDEASQIHELMAAPVRVLLNIESGPLLFAWVIPALLALLVLGLFFIRFWRHLPSRTRYLFLAALVVFVSGAAGMEIVAADYYSQAGPIAASQFFYACLTGIEEAMEMIGASIFIYSLLDYIARLPANEKLSLRLRP